jgi:prepilin-type N-terminal cleavage/methylation domain-containing protein
MDSFGPFDECPRGGAHARGFTLLEVMIAISILGIGSVVLLTTIISISEMNARNREQAVASRRLAEMAEYLKDNIGEYDNDFIKGYHEEYHTEPITFFIDGLWPTDVDADADPSLLLPEDGSRVRALGRIKLYLNEQDVPPQLGGDETRALDLNGDGDTQDDWTEPVRKTVDDETNEERHLYGNNLVGVGLSAHWRTGRGEASGETVLSRYFLVARSK